MSIDSSFYHQITCLQSTENKEKEKEKPKGPPQHEEIIEEVK